MPKHQHLQSRGGDDVPPNFRTQRQHILDLLMAAEGGEVPLAEIMVCAAQYNFCIHKLRKSGYKIANRTETRNGVRHSWYRLASSPEEVKTSPPSASPSSIKPAPSRKRSARTAEPAPPPIPSRSSASSASLPQTLSLFPDLQQMDAPTVLPQRPVWRDPELGGVKHG
jgi:hypothetical protein